MRRRIGKKIGGCLYVHKSVMHTLTEDELRLVQGKEVYIPKGFNYEIIKINFKEEKVSFIDSPDWDTASEPLAGDGYYIDKDNNIKFIKSKGQIYHHKWLFVADDYLGFDIEESKKRSEYWKSVIPQTKEVLSRIGYKKYWVEILDTYNIKENI